MLRVLARSASRAASASASDIFPSRFGDWGAACLGVTFGIGGSESAAAGAFAVRENLFGARTLRSSKTPLAKANDASNNARISFPPVISHAWNHSSLFDGK